MKKIIKLSSSVVIAVSLISLSSTANAIDYTQVFAGTTTGSGTQDLVLPIKGNTFIASKYNQPRNVSPPFTNPHRGTDIVADLKTPVYAVWKGKVIHAGEGDDYQVDIALDLNGDGLQNDNAYVRYDHLYRIDVKTGQSVLQDTPIGVVGDKAKINNQVYSVAPHLHFGIMKQDASASGRPDYWVRNEPFYRYNSNWNKGKDLDFISYSTWDNGSIASVYAYTYSDGIYIPLNVGDVVIYHRRNGTSAWGAITASEYLGQFYTNLRSIYPVGTKVDWMAKATRSDLPSTAYRCAYHQPKFAQPDCTPSSSYAFDYFTNTIQ
jgi:murein DD-endopeptidase MepM/ murein hydrolase activator NlpD